MYTVTKEFKWDSAHRLFGHKGKCVNCHGHTYRAAVTLSSTDLNEMGMVIDFYDLKKIQQMLDDKWDHATLINSQDKVFKTFLKKNKFKHFIFQDANPTAENMCSYLFRKIGETLPDRVCVENITVWETPTTYASYNLANQAYDESRVYEEGEEDADR